MAQYRDRQGMQSFIIIWVGQLVSIVGSGLTSFALGVWVYQQTGSVTQLALVTLCYQIGLVVASFLAGPLIDRWNRRLVMIFSDCGASLCTLTVALLFFTNRLEMWNLYLCVAGNAAFSAVQWPAYSGAISLLVPQHHLGRANGLVQLGRAIAEVVSPVLAGVLIGLVRLQGVILIDYTTFLFALATLLVVRIPTPGKAGGGETVKDPSPRGMLYGWTFIAAHPGMLALLIYMAVIGFNYGIAQILIVPLVLGFASPATLGIMLSMGSGGLLAGGIVMSVWGGARRRIYGAIGFGLLLGVGILGCGARPSVPLVTGAICVALFTLPIISGSAEAIWQSKVAPDIQGRVFAARNTVTGVFLPLASLLAGPLADRVFEPFLAGGSLGGEHIGQIVGVGPGRGIGLLFIVLGIATVLMTVAALGYSRLRRIEDELPDAMEKSPGLACMENEPAL